MKGGIEIRESKFPTRDEFYETIIKLKIEREKRREAEYLAYLREQKFRQKPQRRGEIE